MTYRSHADLGGQAVASPVVPEPEGDPFHAPWEARIHALAIAMAATGTWNLDMTRAARETLPEYRDLSYYEIWFGGLVALLNRHGLVTPAELATGRALDAPHPLARVLSPDAVMPMLRTGSPTARAATTRARFAVGDRVRTVAIIPAGHTRLPEYARGRGGRVEAVRGVHVFPDAHATGLGEQPHWLYTVVFTALELWGPVSGPGNGSVSIDAWEPYLEPM